MQKLQSDIDRLKVKQLFLRQLKVNNGLKYISQEDFDKYIHSLLRDQKCRHMTGISEIINLCNNELNCKFKGELYKSFTKNPKVECLRERIIRFERMLNN